MRSSKKPSSKEVLWSATSAIRRSTGFTKPQANSARGSGLNLSLNRSSDETYKVETEQGGIPIPPQLTLFHPTARPAHPTLALLASSATHPKPLDVGSGGTGGSRAQGRLSAHLRSAGLCVQAPRTGDSWCHVTSEQVP